MFFNKKMDDKTNQKNNFLHENNDIRNKSNKKNNSNGKICKFFHTEKGCQLGSDCPFVYHHPHKAEKPSQSNNIYNNPDSDQSTTSRSIVIPTPATISTNPQKDDATPTGDRNKGKSYHHGHLQKPATKQSKNTSFTFQIKRKSNTTENQSLTTVGALATAEPKCDATTTGSIQQSQIRKNANNLKNSQSKQQQPNQVAKEKGTEENQNVRSDRNRQRRRTKRPPSKPTVNAENSPQINLANRADSSTAINKDIMKDNSTESIIVSIKTTDKNKLSPNHQSQRQKSNEKQQHQHQQTHPVSSSYSLSYEITSEKPLTKKSNQKQQRRQGKLHENPSSSTTLKTSSPLGVVNKPIFLKNIDQIKDPIEQNKLIRLSHINQLKIRYKKSIQIIKNTKPQQSSRQMKQQYRQKEQHQDQEEEEITFIFKLIPSDPDFPFDLPFLGVELHVPLLYPVAKPILKILNNEIPVMLKTKIEIGWSNRVDRTKFTLLQNLNWLDRELEMFLVQKESNIVLVRAEDVQVAPANLTYGGGHGKISSSGTSGTTVGAHDNVENGSSITGREGYKKQIIDDKKIRINKIAKKFMNLEKIEYSDETASDFDDCSTEKDHSDYDDDHYTTTSEEEAAIEETQQDDNITSAATTSSFSNPRIGTQIKFNTIILQNISLLTCTHLSLIVQCQRCKSTITIEKLITNLFSLKESPLRVVNCSSCKSMMRVRYRGEMLHTLSNHIGFLDLEGCHVFDLLPLSVVISCMHCEGGGMTNRSIEDDGYINYNEQQVQLHQNERNIPALVIGIKQNLNCLNCHQKMELFLDGLQFIHLGSGSFSNMVQLKDLEMLRRKNKKKGDQVSLMVGTALNKNGTCKHYKKSYRWLRFPCCNRLYPCDSCHEELKSDDHEMIRANRMVCGFCSREMSYMKEKTCVCGKDVVRRTDGKGFWEGGKGTRDKVKMSRSDARKYKNLNKTKSIKNVKNK